jgi:hypothetical protein
MFVLKIDALFLLNNICDTQHIKKNLPMQISVAIFVLKN